MDQVRNELKHYGVLGMKWGKRRSQNPDGSLTTYGQKKVSKKYKRESIKAQKAINKTASRRQINAYNKTADEYNNGKIEKFNKKHNPKDPNYEKKYFEQLNRDLETTYNRMTVKELESTSHYQKGKALVDKYNMTTFDDLARDNMSAIEYGKTGKRR